MKGLCAQYLMESLTCIVLGMGAALRPAPLTEGRIGVITCLAY